MAVLVVAVVEDVVVVLGGNDADVEVVELAPVEVGGGRMTVVVLVTPDTGVVFEVLVMGPVVNVVVAGEDLTGVGVEVLAACGGAAT